MKRRACLLGPALILALGGCGLNTLPSGAPTIEGRIGARDVSMTTGASTTLHVQQEPTDGCGIIFGVGGRTRIVYAEGPGRHRPASAADLEVGRRVRVWADGYVMLSCPAQAGARAIEILPG